MNRTRENAYRSHPEHKAKSNEDRGVLWDQLKLSIQRDGFNEDYPITIQLLRKDGVKDQIKDGHHRLAIAEELGIQEVPVRFLYDAK